MKYIGIYYVVINLISFTLFFIDKNKAERDKWRIKERTLHLFSFLGGAIGSIIAMNVFHHKTKKLKFCIITGLALIYNILILVLILYYNDILRNIM